MAMPVKGVLFDVGETLAYPHPSFAEAFSIVCKSCGVSISPLEVEAVQDDLWKLAIGERTQKGYSFSTNSSEKFWLRFYREFLSALQIQGRDDLLRALYDHFSAPASYRLFADVVPVLHELRKMNLVLGVVSNWEGWLQQFLEEKEIADFFQVKAISGIVRLEKPDPEIFIYAMKQADLLPCETVHVGDSVENDLLPSRSVGIVPILLDRHNRCTEMEGLLPSPPLRVTSLEEIPPLLATL